MVEAVTRHPRLRVVGVRGANLSSLKPGLLGRMVEKLEEMEMNSLQLTKQQLEAVMTALYESDSRLKKLDISNNDLSNVDASLLASAVNRLEEVEMNHTKLTVEQGEAILTQSLVKTSLRRLQIRGVRVRDKNLVARAKLVIGELLM